MGASSYTLQLSKLRIFQMVVIFVWFSLVKSWEDRLSVALAGATNSKSIDFLTSRLVGRTQSNEAMKCGSHGDVSCLGLSHPQGHGQKRN